MRTIAFLLLAAAANGLSIQDGRAAAPTSVDTQASAKAAEEEAAKLTAGLDWKLFSSEPEYARQTREKLERLRASASNSNVIYGIDALRHLAFLFEGRNAESLGLAQELLGQDPSNAALYSTALWAALYAEEPTAAVALLEKAAKHVKDPEGLQQLRTLPADLIWPILRQLGEKKDTNGEARAAEALLIVGGNDRQLTPWIEGVRGKVIEGKVDAGKFDDAQKLAREITDPRQVIRLIGAKRYDRLFSGHQEGQRRLAAAIAAHGTFTAAWLARSPDDPKAILARGQHLRSVGEEEEALAILLPGAIERTRGDAGDDAYWIVNEAAYALAGLGRHPEAVALMEKLLELPLAEHPQLVSMAINQGAILLSAGRYADAVAWDKALEARAKGLASEYGFMWLWSTAACAESLAGNASAAVPWLAKLAASSEKNEAAHMRGLLCANDFLAAETLILKRLDGDTAEDLLVGLHDYQLGSYHTEAERILDQRARTLLERPKVKAAIEAKGRRLTLPLSKIYWGDI